MPESVWGPVQPDMTVLLTHDPDDVPAVVDQLTTLQDLLERVPPLPGSNPLADFNKLYLRITTSVLERLYEGRFADPAFLSRLDVEFAARYFEALRHFSTGNAACPQVWSVLFCRAGDGCRPVPPAAAGLTAHIAFDLPFALVTTFDHLGSDPMDDGDQHHDYLQINEVFAEAVPELCGMVAYTRNLAWRDAQRLWDCRHDLRETARERERLDGNAVALGRRLLSPMGAARP